MFPGVGRMSQQAYGGICTSLKGFSTKCTLSRANHTDNTMYLFNLGQRKWERDSNPSVDVHVMDHFPTWANSQPWAYILQPILKSTSDYVQTALDLKPLECWF